MSLEAQSVASGGPTKVSQTGVGRPAFGSYGAASRVAEARVSNAQYSVAYTVRNFGSAADPVKVDWYFVAAPVATVPSATEFVFDRGAKDLLVPATGTESNTVASKPAVSVYKRATTMEDSGDATYIGYNNSETGTVLRGWFVRLVADGQVLAVKGSSQKYEDIAKSDAAMKALENSAPKKKGR